MRRWVLPGMLGLSVIFSGCGTNPITGKREIQLISTQQEVAIGSQQFVPLQQSSGGQSVVLTSVQDYVSRVGQRVAAQSDRPDLPYEFVVLNSPVPNAWALPGGKIAVNRGLLLELESEAELAAVLAHEVTHAAARHGAKAMERGMLLQAGLSAFGETSFAKGEYGDVILATTGVGAAIITSKYSRDAEREADSRSIVYLARAGYNPYAAVALQEKFVRLSEQGRQNWLQGLFASHPASQERLERNRRLAAAYQDSGFWGEEAYQAGIADLVEAREAFDLLDEGRVALERGQLRHAHALVRQGEVRLPGEPALEILEGDIRFAQGNFRAAIRHYNDAVSMDDSFYYPYLKRAKAWEKLGNKMMAQEEIEKSLAILSTAEGHALAGELQLGFGQTARGLEHLRVAVQADPVGQEDAMVLLTRTELRLQPDKYFHTYTNVDADGYLVVSVENRSVVAAEGLVVHVTLKDQTGRERVVRDVTVVRRVPAGHKVEIDTDIRMEGFLESVYHEPVIETAVIKARAVS